jgi:sugar/nucleoside kinase (ribokinase family)
MAAYISFIFILNILQHIYGIMASVLDTVAAGDAFNSVSGKALYQKLPFPEGICSGAVSGAECVHRIRGGRLMI